MAERLAEERIEHVASVASRLVEVLRLENNGDALLAIFLVLEIALAALLEADTTPSVRAELERLHSLVSAHVWSGARELFVEQAVQ